MSTSIRQIKQLFDHRGPNAPLKVEKPKPRLDLTWLDRLPMEALVSDDVTNLVADARLMAEALAGDDPDAARVRLLSRLITSTRSQLILLETKHNQCLTARDRVGVDLLDRAVKSTANRLVLLLAEHRASCTSGRYTPPVVAVSATANPVVRGGRSGRRLPR